MIKGEKIFLCELRCDDANVLFRWINDPETVRFNAPFAPVHEIGHIAWFNEVIRDATRVIFGIREHERSRLIGLLQLFDIHPVHRSAELMIRIGEEADRNFGAGSEAVELAAKFAFHDRNLQRVWLRVFADNKRAIRAYEKAGLQVEGTLRRACFVDGRWRDEVVMAILSDASG
jgi:RimJ/RimL family protein N-acetyltransferase